MGWHGELCLHYSLDEGRLRAQDRHHGPLRVLKLHAGHAAHAGEHVLVHPPGGLAGGDELDVQVRLCAGTEVRITTPGATRFYRSLGEPARQSVQVHLEAGAVLEWLPLETIAHAGCRARNELRATLEPGSLMLGWDVACLGLPAAGDRFDEGEFEQHLEVQDAWLERGCIRAGDTRLRQSPLGLDGHPVWATIWCAAGEPWSEAMRQTLVQAAVDAAAEAEAAAVAAGSAATSLFGATSPGPRVVAVRMLAHRVEPVFQVLRPIRRAWRDALGLGAADEPRIWRL